MAASSHPAKMKPNETHATQPLATKPSRYLKLATGSGHFQRKCTKIRPKLFESFSTRWYKDLISFCAKKRSTRFLQRAGALPGNDLDQRCLPGNGLVDDRPQGAIEVTTSVVDVMQVELELHT